MPAAISPRAIDAAVSLKNRRANRRLPSGMWRASPSSWRSSAPRDSREGCVAFYLLDEGLPELEKRVGRRVPWRERRLRFLYRHPTLLYLGSLAALTTGIASAFLFAAHTLGVVRRLMLLLLGTLALFPASELATLLRSDVVDLVCAAAHAAENVV